MQRRAEGSIEGPSDRSPAAVSAICDTLRQLLADVFVLYVKTKSFHGTSAGHISATITFFSTSRQPKSLR